MYGDIICNNLPYELGFLIIYFDCIDQIIKCISFQLYFNK